VKFAPQRRQIVLGAIAVIAVAAAVWLLWPDGDKTARVDQEPSAPVIVGEARFESSAAMVQAVGTGKAVRAVALHPEVSGQVTQILFQAGAKVEKGAALLRLDDEEQKLAVDLARLRLKEARQLLVRYEQASPSGAVSASEVDAARIAVDAAAVQLSQSEVALSRRTIRAPFDGVMGIAQVEQGDRVTEATMIATLDDRSALHVDFDVPEAFAYGISTGQEINATTWALPGKAFSGEVESVASRIDPSSRLLRVRGRFANPEDQLRTGMSFVVQAAIGGETLISVPSISVQWARRGAYVWRVNKEGRVERVDVAVRKRSKDWVLVEAPLEAGDSIVTEGVLRLSEGMRVEIRQAETRPASSPISSEKKDDG